MTSSESKATIICIYCSTTSRTRLLSYHVHRAMMVHVHQKAQRSDCTVDSIGSQTTDIIVNRMPRRNPNTYDWNDCAKGKVSLGFDNWIGFYTMMMQVMWNGWASCEKDDTHATECNDGHTGRNGKCRIRLWLFWRCTFNFFARTVNKNWLELSAINPLS